MRLTTLATAVTLTIVLVGCDADTPTGVMDRDDFIAAWVELRAAAVTSADGVLAASERERLLEARGTTADALAAFVDAHGDDPAYMDALWREVLDSLEARGVGATGPVPGAGGDARPEGVGRPGAGR